MNKKVLLLIAGGIALAGCAQMPAPTTLAANQRCQGSDCDVIVTVTRTSSAPGCSIDLPDHVAIVPNPGGVTHIRWKLAGANGFKFAQPYGIAFDKPPPLKPPPANVMPPNGGGGGPVVTLNDNHKDQSTAGSWSYSVYVTDGSVNCSKDPWVDNT